MYPSVTAILVVHGAGSAGGSQGSEQDGPAQLRRTLDALREQTRQPDAVIAVACDAGEEVLATLQEFGVTQIVTTPERLGFGQAVAAGVRVTTPPRDSSQLLWMLAQDTVPAPDALARLVGALEVSPSVAVAGPKVMDARDDATIVSLGETITHMGATVALVEDEMDQGQHDTDSDVMGVAPAGMLVRHLVWDDLGGFDPGLPVVDDSLDFCVRARLAGHRVVVVPEARVSVRDDGVAGPKRSARISARRRRARQARAAQLHRRLVYAPGAAVWLHWLTLVPLAFARAVWRLVAKQPELIGAEIAAAFGVAFGGGIGQARRSLHRSKRTGWSGIAPLRLPASEVRRRNRLRREASAAFYTIERSELNFFGGGGAWVVLASAVIGAAIFFPLLTATSLQGGALLPLSGTVGELWRNVGWIWHDGGLGFAGAADPFAAVLAVLGTLTFWQPSYALVLLWLLAAPLATLGGWFAATRLTERSGYRIVAAVLWTAAPPLWSALIDGRPAGVIVHLLLPWVFYAGVVAARSWAAAGVASILVAATLAASPSLAPAFVVLWLIAIALAGRQVARVVWLLIPAAALFAPLVWQQGVLRGNWLQLLADPGPVVPWTPSSGWQLAAALPAGEGRWPDLLATLGLGAPWPALAVPVLLLPLAIVALAALFLPGSMRAATLLVTAFLGLVTAFGAVHLALLIGGSTAVPIWAGAGLSLYWLGVAGSAVVCLDSLRRAGAVPAIAVGLVTALAVVPLVAAVPTGATPVVASNGRTLPAFVAASAQQDPSQGTLIVTPQPDGGVAVAIVRGAGPTLDDRSTVATTTARVTDADSRIAELAGNLVADSGLDTGPLLSELGVRFVLLAPPSTSAGEPVSGAASARAATASASLDSDPALAHVGPTDKGTLWRFDGDLQTRPQNDRMPWMSTLVAVGLAIVFAIALLLSVPTTTSRRIAEMTPRTVGRRLSETETRDRSADRPRRSKKPTASERSRRAAERITEEEAERAVESEVEQENGPVADDPDAEGTEPSVPAAGHPSDDEERDADGLADANADAAVSTPVTPRADEGTRVGDTEIGNTEAPNTEAPNTEAPNKETRGSELEKAEEAAHDGR